MKFVKLIKAKEKTYIIWVPDFDGELDEVIAKNLTEQGVVDCVKKLLKGYKKDCIRNNEGFYDYVEVENIEDAKLALREIFNYILSHDMDMDMILNSTDRSDKTIKEIPIKKNTSRGEIDTKNWDKEDWLKTGL